MRCPKCQKTELIPAENDTFTCPNCGMTITPSKTKYERFADKKNGALYMACLISGVLFIVLFFLTQFVMFEPFMVLFMIISGLVYMRCRAELIACKRIAEYDKREFDKLEDIKQDTEIAEDTEDTEK